MRFISSNITIALSLFSTLAYSAPEAVSKASHGITVTAQAMSAGESLDQFGNNLHATRVYPIKLSICNNNNSAWTFFGNALKIQHAEVLTPQGLESSLRTTKMMTGVALIAFFPIAFIGLSLQQEYEDLLSIVRIHSLGDTPITLQPGKTFNTIIFAKIDYEKDADGNAIIPFVAPQHLDIMLPLNESGSLFLGMQIPIIAAQ